MDQQQSAALGFREVDRDGKPVLPETEDSEPAGPARSLRMPNPFIVVLWLLAAGLIAGGLNALLAGPTGMWTLLRGPVAIGPISNGFSIDFVLFTFAPHLVLAGFAALIFLLFWHAWQWQRRRG